MAYVDRRIRNAGATDTSSGMSDATPITILTVDDHALLRAGLAAVIGSQPDLQLVAEASNGEEAIEAYRLHRPSIVLMDMRMPVMDGVSAIEGIRDEFPDARIIALTTYEGDEDIHRALSAGARGYLLKDTLRTELLQVIRSVHRGMRGIPAPVAARLAEHTPRIALTTRELEVLELMAKGLSNPDIAAQLGRAESTMKVHVRNILQKLGTDDRTAAVMIALRRGIIHLD
ncbi:MAG TPA: response regulator transcription factor [Gemmatimonas sp.]|uniref:response regulator transcription factor n=1 Tax=Gemmatimonas sp. TaxID=1962908 RepID=UPI002EDAB738